jgi:hypothetical protein
VGLDALEGCVAKQKGLERGCKGYAGVDFHANHGYCFGKK